MKFSYLRNLCALAAALLIGATAHAHSFKTYSNIQWASPDNHPLTVDLYVPDTGKESYPVLVIYHGGGWLINTNVIMRSMSEYIASKGEYVVANMNYRLLGDNNNTVTVNQIVEDVFGGLLWVKDNIAQYKGDPNRVAVTGDSAGGHLTSMILVSGRNLNSKGFAAEVPGFNPTYLPKGETAESVAARDGLKVQAAVVSYGAFDLYQSAKHGFESESNIFWTLGNAKARGILGTGKNPDNAEALYKAVSPIYNIPAVKDYQLPPQFHHVAENDKVTTPASIQRYVDLTTEAGQEATLKVYPGRNHAFLDNGCTEVLQVCFDRDAPAALDDILAFLNGIFYPHAHHH